MQNKITSVLLLFLFGLISVATSYNGAKTYVTHSYSVATNCNNATMTSGQISVTEQVITSPSETNFMALGFPVQTLNVGDSVSGELAPALTRTCAHSLDTSTVNTVISVYTCSDNGTPSCTINLTHLD
jgi:hypothetical protein